MASDTRQSVRMDRSFHKINERPASDGTSSSQYISAARNACGAENVYRLLTLSRDKYFHQAKINQSFKSVIWK